MATPAQHKYEGRTEFIREMTMTWRHLALQRSWESRRASVYQDGSNIAYNCSSVVVYSELSFPAIALISAYLYLNHFCPQW